MILPAAQPSRAAWKSDAPRWLRLLVRTRFLLAGLYFLSLGLLSIDIWSEGHLELKEDWLPTLIVAIIFFGMQAMLLVGAPHVRWPRPTRRRWMAVSLIAGSIMAGMLTWGFIFAITSLVHEDIHSLSRLGAGSLVLPLAVAIPWAMWFGIFALGWMGSWNDQFRRMYRLLLAGTVLELIVTVPVDAAVRKRTQCYCGEGTFFSLVIGITMVFWTFGPGIVFLFLDVRGRRRSHYGLCTGCGYDLRGLPEARCPECGLAFDPSRGSQA